ncbi:MAG: hypothetical protein AAFX65_00785 [Cyanobacteria bacterium J06638_7]
MSFDARSLERLRQLGRSLPQRLPPPAAPSSPAAPADQPPGAQSGTGSQRHRLETETDPSALFHELMRASADGSAPPHLLERLRELEGRRAPVPPSTGSADPRPGASGPQATAAKARRRQGGRPDPGLAREHGDLYTAFRQLLLEDDEP